MSDLDEKLDKAINSSLSLRKARPHETEKDAPNSFQWFRPNNGELWFYEFDKEAVKQAFADEGYLPIRDGIDKYIAAGGDEKYYVISQAYVDKYCMTGQEWLARFEKELPEPMDEGFDFYQPHQVIEAARKAAGLE